jgi:hypothetical protein
MGDLRPTGGRFKSTGLVHTWMWPWPKGSLLCARLEVGCKAVLGRVCLPNLKLAAQGLRHLSAHGLGGFPAMLVLAR